MAKNTWVWGSDLILHVKKEFFDQIKSGEKTEEFRSYTPFWGKRLQGCTKGRYRRVVICLGYPKKGYDLHKWLIFPWSGIEIKKITHPHFGSEPVEVFAIKLERPRETPASH